MAEETRTRFAPSPTGALHIGGVRTALFSWLQARHSGGKFILRIEDTDAERSTEENTRQILESMEWLGLDWDEGPFFQAQRLDLYRSYMDKLIDEGKAYWCDCTPDDLERKRSQALQEGKKPKYDGTCRKKGLGPGPGRVVRFLMPDTGATSFEDLIKGRISMENAELDDLILLRSDGMPTYNFTVVIDDATMNMTHIIRGDDHVNNTPRQVKIYEALGFKTPLFAHVPMILGPDKTKLSKRHGATSVMAYQDMGFLPEALVNYLVRLSWSHGDQEIFSREELIRYFDVHDVGRAAAVFNPDKLLWLNHHYIKTGDPGRLAGLLGEFITRKGYRLPEGDYVRNVVTDVRERTKTLAEMVEFGDFYFREADPPEDLRKQFFTEELEPVFKALIERFSQAEQLDKASAEESVKALLEQFNLKFKTIAQPMRLALTGKTVSPGIFEIIATLGKDRVISRLEKAWEAMSITH
ncbi:MAG TPA: glutamate--tRNA ligase [Deltaproteobacteria bacterium]|nr:glutamate--tRNA ligase [Deltaproteobacteria bacterium]HPR55325.1 glutamate--tRNA ligase [Deltaproteobacteria bacterium]HXK47451.1 glutamate--tRNA ligase [Deltaproteobacteria bacterium]